MAKIKRYDFIQLENTLDEAHKRWQENDCAETRSDLYNGIVNLAHAVISTRKDIDFKNRDSYIYEYSVIFFERIVMGKKKIAPKEGYKRFAWNQYMQMNILGIVRGQKYNEFYTDCIDYLGDTIGELTNKKAKNDHREEILNEGRYEVDYIQLSHVGNKLYKQLLVYYTHADIKRLYPFASDIIYTKQYQEIFNKKLPYELRDFIVLMCALAKRIIDNEKVNYSISSISKNDYKKALEKSLNSSLFLSTVANSRIYPFELLLSCDLQTIMRLCTIAGGRTIKIPTVYQMELLMTAVKVASEQILYGSTATKINSKLKKDIGIVIKRGTTVNKFASKIIEIYNNTEEEKETIPLIELLLKSVNNFEALSDKLKEKSKDMSPEQTAEIYRTLSENISNITTQLIKTIDRDNK